MTAFAPGSRVVIRYNPFHDDAVDIVGTVTKFEPGGGFMGCDMAYVRYELTRDGSTHELPFATYNLDLGNREALIARAERHETQAAKLRAMANEGAR